MQPFYIPVQCARGRHVFLVEYVIMYSKNKSVKVTHKIGLFVTQVTH